jgi:hypothetical protein
MTEFEVIKTANEISNRQIYPVGAYTCDNPYHLHNQCIKDANSKLSDLLFKKRRELEALENAELFLKHYIK